MESLPEPESEETDDTLSDEVANALGALPAQSREAVELLKLQGLNLEEAARRLDISVPALKARAHRGYVLLRQQLFGGKRK